MWKANLISRTLKERLTKGWRQFFLFERAFILIFKNVHLKTQKSDCEQRKKEEGILKVND